jgi:hypothetical protein
MMEEYKRARKGILEGIIQWHDREILPLPANNELNTIQKKRKCEEIITECPFFNDETCGCELGWSDTCYVYKYQNERFASRKYTIEENEENEFKIGDIVGVHFYSKVVPGIVVHRRGKRGCKVIFSDSKGNVRCSGAAISGLWEEN